MYKKLLSTIILFLSVTTLSIAQTTFPWNDTYGGAGTNRTYTTTVSGVTMSATIVNSENVWQDASPRWFPTGSTVPGGGCSGITATNQGLLLSTDWTTNATKTITTTITFSTPVQGPVNFFLYDINDDGFGSWVDRIIITGTNSVAAPVNCFRVGTACVQTGGSVTGSGTPTLTFNSGSSTACTCWGNNEVNVGTSSDCISTVTIQYRSANTTYNNPKQYVVISNVRATIPAPAADPTSITGTTTICAGQSTTLTAVGGNASSQWYTGSCGGTLVGTGASITVSPGTTTTYFVRNAGSACSPASACISIPVTVNPAPAAPTISTSGPLTFCAGGSVTLTSSSATGNTWSTGATTQSITVSTSGTYTVNYLSGGCASPNASSTVTVNPLPPTPTISASGPLTFCTGGSVTLTSSSTTGNNWSTGATTQSITVNASGTYTVNVTNINGCTSSNASSTVTVNPLPPAPTISTSGPLTFCAGGSVTLTSSSATGNTWSTGATTQSITVSSSGTYTVNYLSGGCASPNASSTVTVNPLPPTPTISASGPLTFCTGGSVTLTSSSATGNSWSTGATTQSITVNSSGTYTVNVTNINGCTSSNASSTVTVNSLPPTPTVSAGGPISFCAGNTVTLTSSSASGNTWSTGATTQSITVNTSGIYSVTVGSAGCSATSANTTVTVNPIPSAPTISASGPLTFCTGGSVTLTSSSTTGNNWSTGATTQSITVNSSGTYTVNITDGNGCTSSNASTSITVNPLPPTPTVSAGGPLTFCAGGSVTLTSSSATGNTWSTGATTQNITVSTAGNYSVTVTASGCSSASANTTVTVNPLPPTPTISASGPLAFCAGGSVTLTSSSATGNTWSTGATTQNITVSTAGTYTVNVTDINGCTSSTASTTITVNPLPSAPTISASGPLTFCTGGSVTLTSSSATGNTWSTGATTQSITVNSSGTYTLSYIDGNSCTSATASTTVTEVSNPPVPTITASGPLTFCAGDDVTLTSSSTAGNTWSTGATTQSITVSAAGNYSVTVGAAGCSSSSANTTVSVNPNPTAPTISTTGNTVCAGQTVTLTSSSVTGNSWSNGATSQSITVNSSGTYSVTITDGNGCSSPNTSAIVTVNPLPPTPTVSASGPLTFCAGGTVTLTSSSATGNSWSTGATSQSITVNNSGTYTVNVTDINGCTSSTASATITVNPLPSTPTISASGPLTFCAGGSVTLTSSSVTGNNWSNGETTQNISVSTSGTYSVIVSDINGCTASAANTSVIVNPNPSAPIITDSGLNICAGQTTTLTSSSATNNNWSTGETTQTIAVNSSGTYTLTITNASGCSSSPTSVVVTVNSNPSTPTISASGPLSFCQGDSVTLTSSSVNGNTWSTGATTQSIVVNTSGTYSVTVGAAGCSAISATTSTIELPLPSTPIISSTGALFCAGQSTTLTSNNTAGNNWSTGETTTTINITTGGNYWLTSTDINGCTSDTAFISITVNSLPNTPIITASSPLTFCQGDSTILSVSPGIGIVWSPTNSTDSSITVNTSGTYTATYTDINGCTSSSAPTTIVVNAIPTAPSLSVSGGNTTICQGQTATINANPTTGIIWLPGGQTTSSIQVNTAGTYYATHTDANGCTSPLDSIAINISTNPIISSSITIDPSSCNQNNGAINNVIVNGGTGVYSYDWYNNGSIIGTDSTLTNLSSGNYTLIVTDQAGCSDTSNVLTVASTGGINVSLTANPSSGMEPFNTNVIANTSTATNSYTWFFNTTIIPGETDSITSFTNLTQGTYTTTVIVTDGFGCADTATITIVVDGNTSLVIPNVFSPNGDDVNDIFFIRSEGYKQLRLEIYDRWGLKLWEIEGTQPSWDGRTTAGVEVTDGTYYYILTGIDNKNTTIEKTGYLSVVK